MLRIRLSRVGKKKQPSYRIVVIDRRKPRDGANVEVIGHFNPLTEPATVVIKEERAIYWLKNGAMPSDTAARLLTNAGIMERAGRKPFVYVGKQVPKGQKNPKKGRKDGAEEGAAPAAAATAAPAAEAKAAAPAEAPAAEAKAEAPAEKPKAEAKTEAPEEKPKAETKTE
ncbi:MAG: 30S ribosomal protein S16, partial [Chloroflexi bacterium]|nr:30S ribosomal protein S16 [Chloroflexota bacterium]